MSNIKALYSFIEEHFKNILNVEDILYVNRSEMPNLQISRDEYYNNSTDNLYMEMRNCRKKAQMLLNLYHCHKEYEKCKPLEIGSLLTNTDNKHLYSENASQVSSELIVEAIAEFVKYHQLITKAESQEITDLLIGSICCYCEQHLDRSKNYCNVCEAVKDEMATYATNHYETLMKGKNQKSKKISAIYKNVDNIKYPSENILSMESGKDDCEISEKPATISNINMNKIRNVDIANEKEKSTVELKINEKDIVENKKDSREWICNKCELLNYDEFCKACLNDKVIIYQKDGQEFSLEKNEAKNSLNFHQEKGYVTSAYNSQNSSIRSENVSLELEKCGICLNETNWPCKHIQEAATTIYDENSQDLNKIHKIETNKTNMIEKCVSNEKIIVKTNRDSDQWKCEKCEMLNYDDFCSACLNERSTIKLWKCENCNKLNDFFTDNCFWCKKKNESIRLCKMCNLIKIVADRDYCDKCFNTATQWRCWNQKCSKLNDSFSNYCGFCKYQRHKKDYFSINEVIGFFWLCQKCHAVNDSEKKICQSFSCKQKFQYTVHKCGNCRKKYKENLCKYCETKCPTCIYNNCKTCSRMTKYRSN